MTAPRVPLVAGNWKMNPTSRSAAVLLAREVAVATEGIPVRTVVCPPDVFLEAVATGLGGGTTEPGGVGIGAQTMQAAESGAFTGETSPLMLVGLAQYVILGHSERRQYDNETDASVAAKVASAIAHGLVPIAAIGETADERRRGETSAVIETTAVRPEPGRGPRRASPGHRVGIAWIHRFPSRRFEHVFAHYRGAPTTGSPDR